MIACTTMSILFFALGHPYLCGFVAGMATTGLFVLSISALRLLMQTPPRRNGG